MPPRLKFFDVGDALRITINVSLCSLAITPRSIETLDIFGGWVEVVEHRDETGIVGSMRCHGEDVDVSRTKAWKAAFFARTIAYSVAGAQSCCTPGEVTINDCLNL